MKVLVSVGKCKTRSSHDNTATWLAQSEYLNQSVGVCECPVSVSESKYLSFTFSFLEQSGVLA